MNVRTAAMNVEVRPAGGTGSDTHLFSLVRLRLSGKSAYVVFPFTRWFSQLFSLSPGEGRRECPTEKLVRQALFRPLIKGQAQQSINLARFGQKHNYHPAREPEGQPCQLGSGRQFTRSIPARAEWPACRRDTHNPAWSI